MPILYTLFAFALSPSQIRLRRGNELGICFLMFLMSSLLYFMASYICYGWTAMPCRGNPVHQTGMVFIVNFSLFVSSLCIVGLAMSRIAYRVMSPGVVKTVVVLVALYPWFRLTFVQIGLTWRCIFAYSTHANPMLLINPATLALFVYVPKLMKALKDRRRNAGNIEKQTEEIVMNNRSLSSQY